MSINKLPKNVIGLCICLLVFVCVMCGVRIFVGFSSLSLSLSFSLSLSLFLSVCVCVCLCVCVPSFTFIFLESVEEFLFLSPIYISCFRVFPTVSLAQFKSFLKKLQLWELCSIILCYAQTRTSRLDLIYGSLFICDSTSVQHFDDAFN